MIEQTSASATSESKTTKDRIETSRCRHNYMMPGKHEHAIDEDNQAAISDYKRHSSPQPASDTFSDTASRTSSKLSHLPTRAGHDSHGRLAHRHPKLHREHFVRVVLSGQGLGLETTLDRSNYILGVKPDSDASRAGLADGMLLISICGRRVDTLSPEEVQNRLMIVSTKPTLHPVSVILDSSNKPIGISLAESETGVGIRIKDVVAGSAAEDSGQIHAGDVITSINDVPATNMKIVDVNHMFKRSALRKMPLSLKIRKDTVTFIVMLPPDAESTDYETSSASEMDTSSAPASPRSRHSNERKRVPLPEIFEHMGGILSNEQKAMVARELLPDREGKVDAKSIKHAVRMVLESSISPTSSSQQFPCNTQYDDHVSTSSSVRIFERRIRNLTQQNNLLQHHLEEANERINELEKERNNATTRAFFNHEAGKQSRKLEDDYEEIISLLEAEIAHLRSILQSSPEQKDKALVALRQRVLVLGLQVNKAVAAKSTVQTACDTLRELIDRIQRRLKGNETPPVHRALALNSMGSLLHRPSQGPIPPGSTLMVGDYCRAPCSLSDGKLESAQIEEFVDEMQKLARVRFQQYNDLPVVEVVNVTDLQPLKQDNLFVVHSAQNGDLARRTGKNAADKFISSTVKQEILKDCAETSKVITRILERQPLPFGWEEAYTSTGTKYYINHVTQTTQWTHPMSHVDRELDQLQSLPGASV